MLGFKRYLPQLSQQFKVGPFTAFLHPKTPLIDTVAPCASPNSLHAWIKSWSEGHTFGLVELSKHVFGVPVRSDILSRSIRYELSWRAQGTESTKALGQVRGSTRKAFPQKGRGKARVGSIRAPQFRGGYHVHGARPHLKTQDIPRKVYRLALQTALSAKFLSNRLIIVDALNTTGLKSALQQTMQKHGLLGKKVAFIYANSDPTHFIYLANQFTKKRLIDGAKEHPLLVMRSEHISVSAILDHEYLVIEKAAVDVLERLYPSTSKRPKI